MPRRVPDDPRASQPPPPPPARAPRLPPLPPAPARAELARRPGRIKRLLGFVVHVEGWGAENRGFYAAISTANCFNFKTGGGGGSAGARPDAWRDEVRFMLKKVYLERGGPGEDPGDGPVAVWWGAWAQDSPAGHVMLLTARELLGRLARGELRVVVNRHTGRLERFHVYDVTEALRRIENDVSGHAPPRPPRRAPAG